MSSEPTTYMDPLDWLQNHAPGFKALGEDEKAAVMHFSLLWSLFEAQVLETFASADKILKKSIRWSERGFLKITDYQPFLDYFKNRYIENGVTNYHFDSLHLRDNDLPQMVKNVLKGNEVELGKVVGTLLIIVYRYRNNLFHGIKWADQLRGQLENFTMANTLMMTVMKLLQDE